jgi:serine/threonine-protein kinase RsbW
LLRRSIHLAATAENLGKLSEFLREFCEIEGVPDDARFSFELVIEELFVNSVTHGAAAAGRIPNVAVTAFRDGDTIDSTFEDDAPAFDPLTQPAPVLDGASGERAPGGLGVHLVKTYAERVEYDYTGARNRITLRMRARA